MVSIPATAQADSDWSNWGAVKRFRGTATIEHRARRNWNDGVYTDKVDELETVTIGFVLERDTSKTDVRGVEQWVPAGPVEVTGVRSMSSLEASWDRRTRYLASSDFAQSLSPHADLKLTLDYETGEFELSLPSTLDQPVPERWTRSEWRVDEGTEASSGVDETNSFASVNFTGKAPREIGYLGASALIQRQAQPDDPGDMSSSTTGTAQLVPEYDDVELEVDVDFFDPGMSVLSAENQSLFGRDWVQYKDWRPRGSIPQPGTAGNSINAIAKLQPKGADNTSPAPPGLPKVKSVRFELVGTSREPGVAMNWPLRAADADFDLRLAFFGDDGELAPDGQSYDVQPHINFGGYPTAGAIVESYDFGGRSELRVTAELEDGRTIYGFYVNQGYDENDELVTYHYDRLLLPKRRDGDWIAQGWRRDHNVADLAADDDGETDPEGDGDAGDGLTLYEEYRGFAARWARGGRVEGDPQRKDLFVLNLIGPDAWRGIKLFESVTGLHVIRRMAKAELDPEVRIINPNHRDAPHVTEQHAIVLKKVRGSADNYRGDIPAGKPATTSFVPMPRRGEYNHAPDQDKGWAGGYDLELAHRMLHAVGVADHGEGDHRIEFIYIPASYKGNNSGRHQVLMRSDGDERYVDLRVEWTGADFFDGTMNDRQLDQQARRRFKKSFDALDVFKQWQLIEMPPTFRWVLGVESGQHSGNEDCPMHRSISMIYRARNPIRTPDGFRTIDTETYYWHSSFDQRKSGPFAPWELCKSPTGTGYNDPKRTDPQPRYGNAMQGRGNCGAQICVNDAIPYK